MSNIIRTTFVIFNKYAGENMKTPVTRLKLKLSVKLVLSYALFTSLAHASFSEMIRLKTGFPV